DALPILREGVPRRALPARGDDPADRADQPAAGAVVHRRAGPGAAEVVLSAATVPRPAGPVEDGTSAARRPIGAGTDDPALERIDVVGKPEARRAASSGPARRAQSQRGIEGVGGGLGDEFARLRVVHRNGHPETQGALAEAIDEAPAHGLVRGRLARALVALVGEATEAAGEEARIALERDAG